LLRFSGLKVVGRVNGPAAGRISSITFSDGTPVEDNRDYRVVLNEFMLNGGDGYTMFQQARNRVKLGGEASYVKKALQQAGRISYQLDDRLTVTNAAPRQQRPDNKFYGFSHKKSGSSNCFRIFLMFTGLRRSGLAILFIP
jgi:hypothetical protein